MQNDYICQVFKTEKMSRTESRKGKSAYFVPTISISLVLIVVGMLVFILLNARWFRIM